MRRLEGEEFLRHFQEREDDRPVRQKETRAALTKSLAGGSVNAERQFRPESKLPRRMLTVLQRVLAR